MRAFLFAALLPLCLGFTANVGPRPTTARRLGARAVRVGLPRAGLFDSFKKAFENQDYSQSPATYEQTNARASHILVSTEEDAAKIKADIDAGLDFSEAALKYSSCSSASRGGKLGKFVPGTMAPEFEEVVFSLYDMGMINPKNEAAVFEPKYALNEVHGPVKTKFGWHLIRVETRYIADYDFRLKEEGVREI